MVGADRAQADFCERAPTGLLGGSECLAEVLAGPHVETTSDGGAATTDESEPARERAARQPRAGRGLTAQPRAAVELCLVDALVGDVDGDEAVVGLHVTPAGETGGENRSALVVIRDEVA